MQAQGIPTGGMAVPAARAVSGHVYVKRGKRGASWYYRARLPHGEVRRKLGPVWDEAGRRQMLQERSPRTVNKLLTEFHGVFERARKAYGLPVNPVTDVEKSPLKYAGDLDFYDPGEVVALVLAAASEQDGALYLTAA